MTLLQSWRDSLSVFKPSNFKLFVLVTLKSLGMTYQVWLKYWWWLPVAYMALAFYSAVDAFRILHFLITGPYFYKFATLFSTTALLELGVVIILPLVYITLFLAARPSMQLKRWHYFIHYAQHTLYIVLTWFVLLLSLDYVHNFLQKIMWHTSFSVMSLLGFILYLALLAGTLLFFILFFLDSDGSISELFKSLWRGFKMMIYNLPGCLLLGLLLFITLALVTGFDGLLFIGLGWLMKILPLAEGNYFQALRTFLYMIVFLPILVNVVTNFYIKRIHDQFNLYYGSNHV